MGKSREGWEGGWFFGWLGCFFGALQTWDALASWDDADDVEEVAYAPKMVSHVLMHAVVQNVKIYKVNLITLRKNRALTAIVTMMIRYMFITD